MIKKDDKNIKLGTKAMPCQSKTPTIIPSKSIKTTVTKISEPKIDEKKSVIINETKEFSKNTTLRFDVRYTFFC